MYPKKTRSSAINYIIIIIYISNFMVIIIMKIEFGDVSFVQGSSLQDLRRR